MSLPLHRFCLEMSHVVLNPVNSRHGSGSFISDEKPMFTGWLADLQNLLNDAVFGLESQIPFNFTLLDRKFNGTDNKLSGCHLSPLFHVVIIIIFSRFFSFQRYFRCIDA